MLLLPPPKQSRFSKIWRKITSLLQTKQRRYLAASIVDLGLILVILLNGFKPAQRLISPLISPLLPLHSLTSGKGGWEVFGFAPYFTFDKLDNVDFRVLTTLAYFGVPVGGDGNLDKDGIPYQTFTSDKATNLFKKAHFNGTRVVLTLTQMQNQPIKDLMDDLEAQERVILQSVEEVENRGIDGLNVDFEYSGDPGQEYRDKFSKFIQNLSSQMHQKIPNSKVTVSVYASAVKEPKIYDISKLSQFSDGIFMMAYDFATVAADSAIPTAPLHGHDSGKYWYDIATAVSDFLSLMSPDKLILGVPYYGYNYLVYSPDVKAETRPWYSWRGKPKTVFYSSLDNIKPDMDGVDQFKQGWDSDGQVGYKAYHLTSTDTWRIVFMEDTKSLSLKYDFAKDKHLKGVGMWALGFDQDKQELWDLLLEKFGSKVADSGLIKKGINGKI